MAQLGQVWAHVGSNGGMYCKQPHGGKTAHRSRNNGHVALSRQYWPVGPSLGRPAPTGAKLRPKASAQIRASRSRWAQGGPGSTQMDPKLKPCYARRSWAQVGTLLGQVEPVAQRQGRNGDFG